MFKNWLKAAQRKGYSLGEARFAGTLNQLKNALNDGKSSLQFHDTQSWEQLKGTQTGKGLGISDNHAAFAITRAEDGESYLRGVHIRMDDTVWSGGGSNLSAGNVVLHEYAHMAGMKSHNNQPPWNWIPGNTNGNQRKQFRTFAYPF